MFSSGWESELKEKNFSGQASVTTREATSMEQDAVYFPGIARNSIAPSMKTLQDEAKGAVLMKTKIVSLGSKLCYLQPRLMKSGT